MVRRDRRAHHFLSQHKFARPLSGENLKQLAIMRRVWIIIVMLTAVGQICCADRPESPVRNRSFPTFRGSALIQLQSRELATANTATFSKSNSRTARSIAVSMCHLRYIATCCRQNQRRDSTTLILRESIAPCTFGPRSKTNQRIEGTFAFTI